MNIQIPLVISPLMEEARMSQVLKKRATKRIKKISSTLSKNGSTLLTSLTNSPTGKESGPLRKCKTMNEPDQTNILGLLETRSIPTFLMDLIKKKRIFN